MSRESNRTEALLEDMNSKINLLVEVVVPMRQELAEVKALAAEIPGMKEDIKTIKAALKATNTQVQDHETRITRLEAQTAA